MFSVRSLLTMVAVAGAAVIPPSASADSVVSVSASPAVVRVDSEGKPVGGILRVVYTSPSGDGTSLYVTLYAWGAKPVEWTSFGPSCRGRCVARFAIPPVKLRRNTLYLATVTPESLSPGPGITLPIPVVTAFWTR